ncbi:MAG: alpha/beta fold hydrolase [Solirubrobacteraceae bacterium]
MPIAAALKGARCGFLVVPENRSVDNGRTIRLAVAIVPAGSSTPAPDPVVDLTGGPGSPTISGAQQLVTAGFNRDRELILMDQRGTGYSQPALTCPEIDRFSSRSVGVRLDSPVTRRLRVAAVAACYRRLAAQGIDLGAYNTAENAADFADLRKALGIAQWNVYGASYGTDLALTLMREHPKGIRTVTLDSVVPPSVVSLSGIWPNVRDAFANLFRACAAQLPCRVRHPGLQATITRLVRRLEAHPLAAKVSPGKGKPAVTVALDGGALAQWMVVMSATPFWPEVPALIQALAAGRPGRVLALRREIFAPPPGELGYGLQYGVACSEWVPYEAPGEVLAVGRRAFPTYPASVVAHPAGGFNSLPDDCRVWGVPKAPPAQRQVTTSTIPTLIIHGTFDAITSLRWAQITVQTLPSSTLASFPGAGHVVVSASPCAQRVFASFLSSPTAPDTLCVGRLRPPALR